MKENRKMCLKRMCLLALLGVAANYAAAKSDIFTVKQGDPLVFLQAKKTAVYEIDYSQLMVTDGKDHDNDMDFKTWMTVQDEDDDKWVTDWETKDKVVCDKAFRENVNDEVKKGLRLTKVGKDYKVILRLTLIDFGPAVKMKIGGLSGGEAKANGEIEVRDIKTGEVLLNLAFENLKGEGSFKQIGRLKGIFENLGEELSDYLSDYKKEYDKQQKKARKKK